MHDQKPCIDLGQLESVYAPLAESIRRLIDVSIRTEAGPTTVAAAKSKIDSAAEELSEALHPGPVGVRYTPDGRTIAWGNAVIGVRNPVAPPLVIHHEPDGLVWSEFVLGAPYEGPPGNVHRVCVLWSSTMFSARRPTTRADPLTPEPSRCVTDAGHRWDGHCARRLMSSARKG